MKKFAKYMGITAATLLAVAPIAAPVISTNTEVTVKADAYESDPVINQILKGTYSQNSDGTYNVDASMIGYKDGQIITLPIKLTSVSMDPIQNSIQFSVPEIKGYKPDRSTMEIGFMSGKIYRLSGFTKYEKIPTGDTAIGTNISLVFSPSIDAQTYDDNGNVTTTTLPKASAWQIDRQMDINGTTYYRVATNEWVKKTDGIEVTPREGQIDTNKVSSLYTSTGKKVTNRALAAHTGWYTDRMATINGQIMYRVATDEWISISDTQYAAF
ncbi:SLAP domain-containing protein [Companilactobacillus pabuli]|jgi:hypothetical protein|uniref:S-layer protein C-terminal domain-containing protein n=1 Tax=Companilactobacillus pabuli TaxID=2714036 RepID=A0A7L7KVA2_9LACO|nr:SLAP domain-containing protein [Companilactobacillus pabuli]AKP04177.1 hypothetical protein ABB45_11445 [Companilactobacillus farciminis]AKS52483.1 hypothetical protein ABB44_11465 [Companilactobacillus farciminis]QMT83753.1 hypothetical protein G6534_03580 [Companilactobacillus pabuli]GAQ01735.1 hypothetical protein NBRC111452_1549 [Companilactobacillus farciminis]